MKIKILISSLFVLFILSFVLTLKSETTQIEAKTTERFTANSIITTQPIDGFALEDKGQWD